MIKISRTCCAIIVAAGSSTRMAGGVSKTLLSLLGVPVIVRTLSAFQQAQCVDGVVVVCRGEDRAQIGAWVREYSLTKVGAVVCGGRTRRQSVACGVAAAPQTAGYLAIHDGARPLVRPESIDEVIRDAHRYGASALAAPVKDTIKVVGRGNLVLSTPERSQLWCVQTPQVFERQLYLRAMEYGGDVTDDCQLVENMGGKVHLCPGDYSNLKLTTKDDLLFAQAILKSREERCV